MNLLMQPGWLLTEATNSPAGTFAGQIAGAFSGDTNSSIALTLDAPLSDDDRLIGTLSWNIDGLIDFGQVWFHIIDRENNVSLFSVKLYEVEVISGPGSTTFDVPASLSVELKASNDQYNFDSGIGSYEIVGSFGIVGAADVIVDPEAPQLPWWYCVPKVPVVCPVRPVGFVPLDEYDADFRFPVASSRAASRIPVGEDCTTCSPTLIGATVVPPPPPVECATTTAYDVSERLVGDVSEYTGTLGSILNGPPFHIENPTAAFYIRLPDSSNPTATYFFYYSIGEGRFQMDWGTVIDFEGATTVLAEFGPDTSGPWSCITISVTAPA